MDAGSGFFHELLTRLPRAEGGSGTCTPPRATSNETSWSAVMLPNRIAALTASVAEA
jgi:hypothetical protein